MNIESIRYELQKINNEKIRLQTLKSQAEKSCADILASYGVSSMDEFKTLVDKSNIEYERVLNEARTYIAEANEILAPHKEIL